MELASSARPEKGKPVLASVLKPFNASTSLVLTLLFLVLWRTCQARSYDAGGVIYRNESHKRVGCEDCHADCRKEIKKRDGRGEER